MSIHTGVRYTHEWTSARTHASQVEADHAARIAAGHASRLAAVGMVAFLAMAAAPAAASDEPVAEGIEAPVDTTADAAGSPAAGSPTGPITAEETYLGTPDGTTVEPAQDADAGAGLVPEQSGRPGKSGVLGIPQQGGHPEAEKAGRPETQLPSQRGGQADDAIVDEVLGAEATAAEPVAPPVAQRAPARVLPNTGPETTAAQTAGGFGLIAAGLALMGRRKRPAR